MEVGAAPKSMFTTCCARGPQQGQRDAHLLARVGTLGITIGLLQLKPQWPYPTAGRAAGQTQRELWSGLCRQLF